MSDKQPTGNETERPSISVFFPAYNDGGTIPSMVLTALMTLRDLAEDYEVIVVNDGSADYTADVLEELAARYSELRVIHHEQNRGYGGALRTGFASSTKDLIFYTDGDAQYDPRELARLYEVWGQDVDFVNGFKISRSDPLHRVIIGRLYHWTVKLAFGLQLSDVDCDFRLMRRSIFDTIHLKSDSGVICVELMKKVQDGGFRITEVPVHHYHRAYGKSQFFNVRRVWRTGKQLWALWWETPLAPIDRPGQSGERGKMSSDCGSTGRNGDESYLDTFRGKRVLITGGLGFIGSNLARALVALGSEILIVDSLIPEYGGNLFNVAGIEDQVRINIADVRDRSSMDHLVQGQDYLFNLAGQVSHVDSMRDPFTDLEINCRSQLSILESCRYNNPGVKVIFASTRQIYGMPDYLPVDERHLVHPTDVNGINKMAGEWYHIVYNNVYGVRAASLRLTNTYGPRMRVCDALQTFLGIWLRIITEGGELAIFGDGRQVRDFNYVEDVVDALLRVAVDEQADGQVYNLGSDEPINLLHLAQLMVQLAGRGSYRLVPWPENRKRIDIGDYYGDYRKIRSKLGWCPRISLEEGLRRTLEFYREHHQHYWESE